MNISRGSLGSDRRESKLESSGCPLLTESHSPSLVPAEGFRLIRKTIPKPSALDRKAVSLASEQAIVETFLAYTMYTQC